MSGFSTLPIGAPDAPERPRGGAIRSAATTDEIPAYARDPPRPAAGRTSGRASTAGDPPFLNSDPAAQPATAKLAGAAFWEAIASGRDRLTLYEDALVWRMRARDRPWHRIAARILELRSIDACNPSPRSRAQILRAYRRARIAKAVRAMMEARR